MMLLNTLYSFFFGGSLSSASGSTPTPTVALKADFSDPNANEAWVFW